MADRQGPAHRPVLYEQVLKGLAVSADGIYLDGTFGRGGHTAGVLELLGGGRVFALDRDPAAIVAGQARFADESRLTLVQACFADLDAALTTAGFDGELDGALFDLGVSSPQLDEAHRGFSFLRDGPLDMRMGTQGVSAAEWLASAEENEIARILRTYGEEKQARRIARAIVAARVEAPLTRTLELAKLIERVMPRRPGASRHPATLTFQAIRLHVNQELEQLQAALRAVLDRLAPGGRLCVISFHSLEDRIVKRFMRDHSRVDPALARLPVVPPSAQPQLRLRGGAQRGSEAEIAENPRARSAVLRVAERLAPGVT